MELPVSVSRHWGFSCWLNALIAVFSTLTKGVCKEYVEDLYNGILRRGETVMY